MKGMARKVCLERRMNQKLKDLVVIWKRAARQKLYSLLGWSFTAKQTRAAEGTELGEMLRNQMGEARRKLGGDTWDDLLCTWRLTEMQDTAYSEREGEQRLGDV